MLYQYSRGGIGLARMQKVKSSLLRGPVVLSKFPSFTPGSLRIDLPVARNYVSLVLAFLIHRTSFSQTSSNLKKKQQHYGKNSE